jgi:hypothetical protein
MRKRQLILSTLAAVMLAAGLVGAVSGATSGFAAYSAQFSTHGVSKSFTVNESVTQTSKPALDRLFISVTSPSSNFTYSKFVNSSMMIQPFLPAVTNQTFSFGSNKTSVSIRLTQNGTAPLAFQGSTYTLTSYAFSAHFSARNRTGSAKGTLHAFPSGLIYSVREDFNGTSTLLITLTATSLPLTAGAAAPAVQVSSIGVGAGVAVSALALGLGVQIRRRKNRIVEKKPEYWVD